MRNIDRGHKIVVAGDVDGIIKAIEDAIFNECDTVISVKGDVDQNDFERATRQNFEVVSDGVRQFELDVEPKASVRYTTREGGKVREISIYLEF